jgi:hypothetical protein
MAIRKNATERTAPTKNVAVTYLKSVRHVFLQLARARTSDYRYSFTGKQTEIGGFCEYYNLLKNFIFTK